MTINNRIGLIIKELGLNPNSFSVAIGVNPTVIHNIIKGRNAPSFDVLNKIALSFDNINMNWLITNKGSSQIKINSLLSNPTVRDDLYSNTLGPPDCEKCKLKDQLIDSLKQQVETQSKLIHHLEDKECPGEGQKRKAAS